MGTGSFRQSAWSARVALMTLSVLAQNGFPPTMTPRVERWRMTWPGGAADELEFLV
jgi:hypothetical protein